MTAHVERSCQAGEVLGKRLQRKSHENEICHFKETTVSNKWELHPLDGAKARALRPEALFDLTGKVAIVTGAGGGIGSWLSAGLAAAGANVLLTDHPKASMKATADAIKAAGGCCEEFSIDLLDPEAVDAIVEAARARFGRLDILVNNAGVNRRERIFDVSRESWDLISTIDLRIPYELSRAAARVMAEGDGGSIIQMGSLNNAIGLAGVSVYGAHKAGLCQLAKSMSVEWAEYKIRVNAICPGLRADASDNLRLGRSGPRKHGCSSAPCGSAPVTRTIWSGCAFCWRRMPVALSPARRCTSRVAGSPEHPGTEPE